MPPWRERILRLGIVKGTARDWRASPASATSSTTRATSRAGRIPTSSGAEGQMTRTILEDAQICVVDDFLPPAENAALWDWAQSIDYQLVHAQVVKRA
jgi:hypothetical protein